MTLLDALNEKQRQAVTAAQGPLLVLAGPGSGKTRTLTHRAAYLIAAGQAAPQQVLCVTFTNKAAEEMRGRLQSLVGGQADDLWIHTFHATALRILRRHGPAAGLPADLTVAGQELQGLAAEWAIQQRDLSRELYPPYRLLDFIGWHKAHLRDPASLPPEEGLHPDWIDLAGDYADFLRARRALDFDDLIVEAVRLLQEHADVRQGLQQTLRHILVDEYQDINRAQYELLTLLAPPGSDVMAVADDDQSIYGWRGADRRLLRAFRHRYRPLTVELTECYRSTESILYAAQNMIRHQRVVKRSNFLHTGRGLGAPIFHYIFADAEQERAWLVRLIEGLVGERGRRYSDIAVLYRLHRLADPLEGSLAQAGIPTLRVRRESFFEEPLAREVVRYLHLIRSLNDGDILLALNFPQTLADELTIQQLTQLASFHDLGLTDLARRSTAFPELSPLTRANLQGFLALFEQHLQPLAREEVDIVVARLFDLLEARRSPFSPAEWAQIRGFGQFLAFGGPATQVRNWLEAGSRLQISAPATADGACAALILQRTLAGYLGAAAAVTLVAEPEKRLELRAAGGDVAPDSPPRSLVLAAPPQPGLSYSLSTVAWRFAQDLLVAHEILDQDRLVVYDLETTGANPRRDEVVEIAAQRVVGGQPDGPRFYALVRPERGLIPRSATQVHGLRWPDVAEADPIDKVLPRFLTYVGADTLAGHNVERFDRRFLDRETGRLYGRGFRNPHLDTLQMARRLYAGQVDAAPAAVEDEDAPRSYSLESLLRHFGLGQAVDHRAGSDVAQTTTLLNHLLAENRLQKGLRSLAELLPLVAMGMLDAKVDIMDENQTLLRGAQRVLQRVGKGAEEPTEDWGAPLAQELADLRRRLAELPPAPPESGDPWRRLRERFMAQVDIFLSFSRDRSLQAFLDYQALATSLDTTAEGQERDRVTLMTLHNAKGTEFPVVIITGLEEENLPLWTAMRAAEQGKTPDQDAFSPAAPDPLAEEQRVFYVGMTRAQDRLYLISVNDRGDGFLRSPSRFAFDLPADYVRRYQMDGRGRLREL